MLENKKVYVGKHSREIQEKAFDLGYEWRDDGKKITCLNRPFLYFYDGGIMTCGADIVDFNNHNHDEISVEEILAMEVPKPKKTIKDLYPLSGFRVMEDGRIAEVNNVSPHYGSELWNTLPTKEEAEAYKILPFLLQWRDKYNDGWEPVWKDKEYFSIGVDCCMNIEVRTDIRSVFTFKTKELLYKFLEDFEEELEIVKPLL